jgi:peptide-methionine (R)-S-oxide reductase
MMTNNPHEHSQLSEPETTTAQYPTRRIFLIGAATAVGAAAFAAWRPSNVHAAAGKAGTVTIIQFSDNGKPIGKITVPKVVKSYNEWKQQLNALSFSVTRHEDTERPYSGSLLNVHEHGIFRCICCDNAIFSSDTKFESGTGWPSFWQPIAKENIVQISDSSFGMDRTAISCRECDAHLGHVFDDGPQPTGLRYCMNSAAMRFVKLA